MRPILEPTGLIVEDPQLRLAGTLLMAPPNLKSNSWKKFSRLALDITAECGYELRRKKRGRNNIGERGASANLDYEAIIFESFGGIK